ncbi:MAG TPA: thioredoxin family protein [Limnochordia bacterium]
MWYTEAERSRTARAGRGLLARTAAGAGAPKHRSDEEVKARPASPGWRDMALHEEAAELAAALAEHADCDYNTRVPSGLEEVDPETVRRLVRQTAERPLVVKFGKDFCGWTKRLNRTLQALVPRYAERADFVEVNIPTYEEVRAEWRLETSPTMILIKDGREVDRTDGVDPDEVIPVFEKWFGPPAA